MTKTIIVPFPPPDQDPEGIAATAIPMARLLARAADASVLLVSAVDIVPQFDPASRRLRYPSHDLRASMLKQANEALAEVAKDFGDLPVETTVVWGDPVENLVALIGRMEEPILVLGSRGRRGLNRAIYGSVAFSLVHEAPCPVLVVRGSAVDADVYLSRLNRIVVPLDRSTFSEEALETAVALLEPGAAIIHLLHVIEPGPLREWPVHEVLDIDQLEARQYLESHAARLIEQGHKVSIEVRSGSPADEITAAAAKSEAGLIVMATHGRSGFSRLVFGSNAERVLQRSKSPLLLIRPQGEAIETARGDAQTEPAPVATRLTAAGPTAPVVWSLTAKDLMTSPPIVAREDTPVSKIVSTMLDHDIGCIPVVGPRGELVGIVSESDFVASDQCVPITAFQIPQCFKRYLSQDALDDIHAAGELLTAGEVMSRHVVAVTEDESVMSVARKLLRPRVRRVPVVRDGVPVGIIAERDLLKILVPGTAERVADG